MSQKNISIGFIAWFILMAMASTVMECLDEGNCGAFDFALFGLIALGMAGPASLLAHFLDESDKKDNND
ncbi:hypothetical protein [Shewanella sp.]|jgi:hypothetical protein|uniref:hypothetical protein n=1 Tax=Shewanella sp. TaxID=50422 RepID=UPI0040483CEB